jgi:hypothetical protein
MAPVNSRQRMSAAGSITVVYSPQTARSEKRIFY